MGYDLDDDLDLKRTLEINNLPFSKWEWEHVVFWIEKIDELKNFASVFSEWKINGEELLQMNIKQIIWLTKCCYRVEIINKQIVKDLIIVIKKEMINTIIKYQYGLYYKQIKKYSPEISDLLEYLQPKKEQGPKALWKLDAFYFSKIDNMLAILIAPKGCQKLFREWNPKFIFDDLDTHTSSLTERTKSTQGSQLGLKNINKSKKDVVYKSPVQTTTNDIELKEQNENEFNDNNDIKLQNDIINNDEKKTESVSTTIRYIDMIDKCANIPCCKNNICGTYFRNFDRVYFKVILLYICVMTFGCLIVWAWMSRRSRMEVDISIKWTAESIVARGIQYMESQFFIPQMILNIVIGGLKSGDININPIQYLNDTRYDEFFVQFKQYKVSENSIHQLCMYESVHNTVICAQSNGTYNMIYAYDGICDRGWSYNDIKKERDINNIVYNSCIDGDPFDPQTRPWYLKAQQLDYDDIGWTEPYIFAVTKDIGITLVSKINYNNIDVIFLAEFTTIELNDVFKAIGSVNGGVTYLATSHGSVIASNVNEYDLNPKFITDCTDCSASNQLLIDSIQLLRNEANNDGTLDLYINGTVLENNNFVLTLNSFDTTYLSGNNFEYGTVVVVYADEHLSTINEAESLTMILYIGSLLLILIILCTMASYLQYLQRTIKYTHDPTGIQIRQQKSLDLDVITEMTSADIDDEKDTNPEALRNLAREKKKKK
eukprot:433882_1